MAFVMCESMRTHLSVRMRTFYRNH